MNIITLQCQREATTHLQLHMNDHQLILIYGTIENGKFKQDDGEGFLLSHDPEFRELYDGYGWNVAALQNLVMDAYCGEDC